MKQYNKDKRVVLTLDAGGTNFVFSALKGLEEITEPFRLPSNADNLEMCIASMKEGFTRLIQLLEEKPVSISFAFPGPADYKNGVIGDLPNLPAFKGGGVPLGPILEEHFNIPVFINNDGNLFALGEAIGGYLPFINSALEKSGNKKQYNNLIGVTLGTGYGGGVVVNQELVIGDNSNAGEIWTMRNRLHPESNAEENIGVGAIIRHYKKYSHDRETENLEPKDIFEIAMGKKKGDISAAKKSFDEMAKVLGDTMASLVNIIDGPVVIGGGISSSFSLFSDSLLKEMNSEYSNTINDHLPRMVSRVYETESKVGLSDFLKDKPVEIKVNEKRVVPFQKENKIPIGLSKLGTSRAISAGAYAIALQTLDKS